MPITFAELTTLRVGGPVGELIDAPGSEALVGAVRAADAAGRPVLVIGGGSNIVVSDDGFDGLVVRSTGSGVRFGPDANVTLDAGVQWDAAVLGSLENGLSGLEALSGIPGSAGGSPIQNIGAYGTVMSDVLAELTVYDRERTVVETWTPDRCGFGPHRQSVFKHSERYVVLDVTFALSRSGLSRPVGYVALADELGVAVGAQVPAADVRTAVLTLRGRRGMLLDAADHDTWSVGSFFLNPVLRQVPAAAVDAPQYPDPAGTKLSAAWLIEHSGFGRGYGAEVGRGVVRLSSKHTLAVTNRGDASAAEVLTFAAHVRDGVERAFGVRLEPECDLINCVLP
ncbi:MAG: UDP-N-acetylmuramate dehydrogenase [Jatrophihabitantaceae bacterium]